MSNRVVVTVLVLAACATTDPNAPDPHTTVTGTAGDDVIKLDGKVLTFGKQTYDLTIVTELTINAGAGNDRITIVSALPTLTKLTIDGGGDSDSLYGPDIATTWNVTGPDLRANCVDR